MKAALCFTPVIRRILLAISVLMLLSLPIAPQEKSVPDDPLDRDGRLKNLRLSEKWVKASGDERKQMEKEITDDWLDFGGNSPAKQREPSVTFDRRKGFGQVIGRIVDEAGKPLAGVSVHFRGYDFGPGAVVKERRPAPAVTDRDGRFSAEKVYGHWNVLTLQIPCRFEFPHYRMEDDVLPGSENPDRKALPAFDLGASFSYFPSIEVLVESGKTTDTGDIYCQLPLCVRGKVTLDGKPMSGVCVMRLGRGLYENRNRDLVCRTDAQGRFEYYVFAPYHNGLVLGIFEPNGIYKSSASFLTAKSVNLEFPVPGRAVEMDFDLQPFADLEFEIDCPDTEWYGIDNIGRFCYFFDKTASHDDPHIYSYWLQEGTRTRRFQVQPGTYDVCLAGTNCTPWLWLRNLPLRAGEHKKERFVVRPDDYSVIEGTVKFQFGSKEFTIAEVADIVKGAPGRPFLERCPLLADFNLFAKCRLVLFQTSPSSDRTQVLPQAAPNDKDGRVVLIMQKSLQSTLEFSVVPIPTSATYSAYDGSGLRLTYWKNTQGDWALDPGITTFARTVTLWKFPLSGDSLPKSLDIKVSLLALVDAALQEAIKEETLGSSYYEAEEYDQNFMLMDVLLDAKRRICSHFRDFLVSHRPAANLSSEDARHLDKLLADLAEYEKLLPFRTSRPQ